MSAVKTLIFIPTYNECDNVEKLCGEIAALHLDCDLLFIDDNSPDGTGELLERLAQHNPRITVQHRSGKLGIGSAHLAGIQYAYAHQYDFLITMDSDFTHKPTDLPKFLALAPQYDFIVGSRYIQKDSIADWNVFRRFLTNLGHFLTKHFLGLQQDASSGLRVYRLKNMNPALFQQVRSHSYSFFFESLFILKNSGHSLHEIPIALPARTYGHSKLTGYEAMRSGLFLLRLTLEKMMNPGRFRSGRPVDKLDATLKETEEWDDYWQRKNNTSSLMYEMIASCYRRLFIKPQLERHLKRNFSATAQLLHAGCGSGQVDMNLHQRFQITAIDLSPEALALYSNNNPAAHRIEQADLLHLTYAPRSFDGIYNLGVFEHFSTEEITHLLQQFKNILKPDGKIVIFWPHRKASSVAVLHLIHYVINNVLKKNIRLHPPEPSLLPSRKAAKETLAAAGFELVSYHFSLRDLFVQAVVVAKPLVI